MGYMIEISESKVDKLAEHAGKAIKHVGKLMECIEEIQESSNSMGERNYSRGSYGNRNSYRSGNYGNRMGYREDWDDDEYEMGERRGVPGSGRGGRYRY